MSSSSSTERFTGEFLGADSMWLFIQHTPPENLRVHDNPPVGASSACDSPFRFLTPCVGLLGSNPVSGDAPPKIGNSDETLGGRPFARGTPMKIIISLSSQL
jgi:hypothetical protein